MNDKVQMSPISDVKPKTPYVSQYLLTKNSTGFIKPRSFSSDVQDEFWMSWIGQYIEQEFTDNGPFNTTVDETYDPFAENNIAGYEEYADQFFDVRNKEDHDYRKAIISRNTQRRKRLDASERDMGPALVAALADPINFIPIPFAKGVAWYTRAAKGGTAAAALVGATEPIRRSYDPTSTNEETMMYVGTSFILGGALSSVFGPRASQEIINKTINSKGGKDQIVNNVNSSHNLTEGALDDGPMKINIRNEELDISINQNRTGHVFNDDGEIITFLDSIPKIKGIIGKSGKPIKITRKTKKNKARANYSKNYAPVVVNTVDGKLEVVVDVPYIRKMFKDRKHISNEEVPNKSSLPNYIGQKIDTDNELVEFLIKKEVWRAKYLPKEIDETPLQYEVRLNQEVAQDSINRTVGDFSTDIDTKGMNWLLQTLDEFTDTGKVMHAYKDDPEFASRVSKKILELSGDYGVVTRASKAGQTVDSSAYLEHMTFWEQHLQEHLEELDNLFVQYMKESAEKVESLTLSGKNITAERLKRKDFFKNIFRFKKRELDPAERSYENFNRQVFDAVVNEQTFNNPKIEPAVKNAALITRKFFKEYREQASELGMFASQKNLAKDILKRNAIITKIDDALNKGGLSKLAIKQLKRVKEKVGKKRELTQEILDDMKNNPDIHAPFEMDVEYITRFYSREAMLTNPTAFKNILKGWYESNPLKDKDGNLLKLKKTVDERVDETYERILGDASHNDADGILSIKNTKGQYKAGGKPFLQRHLNIPNRLLDDFVEKDVFSIMKMYRQRMGLAISITKRFGDRHMDNFLDDLEVDIITNKMNTSADVTKMNRVLNAFTDAKDKMYGTFNTVDPSNVNKRVANFLRNWTSLSSMGKVVYTAQADLGRPVMVHGMSRMWSYWLKPMMENKKLFIKMAKDLKFLAPMAELTQQGAAMERMVGGGMGTAPFQRGIVGSIEGGFQKAQGPYFWANGLTTWTMLMKKMTGYVSQHRIIEDALKVANKTATKDEIARLAALNIGKKESLMISNLFKKKVITLEDGIYLPNATAWLDNGAGQTLTKFRQALKADIERTIITPSPNDKGNMMYGVYRIDSEEVANAFNNPLGRAFGFSKTDKGGKIQNGYMALPFQFYSWMISANRKLMMSGLSGREQHMMQGATAMVAFAMWGDFLKSPEFWYRKSAEEKFLTAVEKSGVLAMFSDLPNIVETMSGQQYGVRPMFGMDNPYGEPEDHDVYRPMLGAAGSNIADIYKAYESGDSDDQKDAIRRFIPLNNFWAWDRMFKKGYNSLTDR